MIEGELYDSYKKYALTLASDCNFNPHSEKFPILFNDPIYGKSELTYQDFMAPGFIVV